MMTQILIAIAAGCASALMFVSIVSGALISLVLFYLAPLPLMVAALGWGAASALVGGLAASLLIGAVLGLPYMVAFAVTIALPAWWLGHLALLARPAESAAAGAQSALDWYPPGRLLAWMAAFASLTTITALLSLGFDAASITDSLKSGLTRLLGMREGGTDTDTEKVVAVFAAIAPVAATVVALATLALNLWLAGKITRTSGRLARPWPVLQTLELPSMTLVALAVALALCFLGGLIAMIAQIVAAALVMAYAFTGFAVLHTLTQSTAMRGLWLGSAYAAVVVFGWPLVVVALLGIADELIGFRRRKAQRLKPPPLSS
ncbi:DUF2232 domain-containing protein [Bradyrhizobium sp. 2TAF24]|uniref:DUF2232 domain-containing protein n=1 Tax=Bradyrhizobium sp. 2TAF24 TaxID=3233011 RepID=UPI003F90B900